MHLTNHYLAAKTERECTVYNNRKAREDKIAIDAIKLELNDQQRLAAETSLEEDIIYISGAAGTGKTFATNAIIKLLRIGEYKHSEIVACAPSHRAKDMLDASIDKELNVNLMTVQRYAGYAPANDAGDFKKVSPSYGCSVVIIDEVSMLSDKMFDEIIGSATKVILLGDTKQLTAVKSKAANLEHITTIELTQQMRQKDELNFLSKGIGLARELSGTKTLLSLPITSPDASVEFLDDRDKIIQHFIDNKQPSKVILGYTNLVVEG